MAEVDPKDALDLSIAPRGELAASRLVQAAAAAGDLAERHYLELKGPPDLSSKAAKHKIAKFILGAANRMTEKAAEAFEGCAVMVIGVRDGVVAGVPSIEMLEISKVVDPFLGVPGPRWDIVRVPVADSDHQVLLVIVEPPKPGQPIYLCRQSGEGLTDGRVYIRAEGETREATSAEQDAMRARATQSTAGPVELEVSLLGSVHPLDVDQEQTLDAYLAATRERLEHALPGATVTKAVVVDADDEDAQASASADATLAEIARFAAPRVPLLGMTPEHRSRDAYLAEIDSWEAETRAAWPDAMARLAGYAFDAVEVAVRNTTSTFLHDLEVRIHLDGDVVSVDFFEPPEYVSEVDLQLPNPPREWGPVPIGLGGLSLPNMYLPDLGGLNIGRSRTSWRNSGSVDVTVEVGDLRPQGRFATDEGDTVLALLSDTPTVDSGGTWTATTRGYDEVFEGSVEVIVGPPRDLTHLVRRILDLDGSQSGA